MKHWLVRGAVLAAVAACVDSNGTCACSPPETHWSSVAGVVRDTANAPVMAAVSWSTLQRSCTPFTTVVRVEGTVIADSLGRYSFASFGTHGDSTCIRIVARTIPPADSAVRDSLKLPVTPKGMDTTRVDLILR